MMARTTVKTERFNLKITAKPGQLKHLTERLIAEDIDLSAAVSQAVGFDCEAIFCLPLLIKMSYQRLKESEQARAARAGKLLKEE